MSILASTQQFLLYPNAEYFTPFGKAKLWSFINDPRESAYEFKVEGEDKIREINIQSVKPYLKEVADMTSHARALLKQETGFELKPNERLAQCVCYNDPLTFIDAITWLRENNYDVDNLLGKGEAINANLSDHTTGTLSDSQLCYNKQAQEELVRRFVPDISEADLSALLNIGWQSVIQRLRELLPDQSEVLNRVAGEYFEFFHIGAHKTKAA